MVAGYSFRPRLWVVAAAVLGCAAGIALAQWQAGRAEEKRAAAASQLRVSVRGAFVDRFTVFLDNKVRHQQAGYEVVTPLRLAGSQEHVLVNRGWIAVRTREVLPEVPTPAGEVRIEGVAIERLPRLLEREGANRGRVRQTLDVPAYAAETGLQLQPRIIEQHSSLDDGLVREWVRADAGVQKHQSYSLQWYSLAVLAAVLGVVFSFRKA